MVTASGQSSKDPERSVFINCPFDDLFKPLMDAIILATVACGYIPRTAVDSGDVARPRMQRIVETMQECRYSIHDLSRCQGSGDWDNYARFNMPLELGMALILEHDWLVIVPEGHNYTAFVSDLGGYDLPPADPVPGDVIAVVVPWLSTRRNEFTISAGAVTSAFAGFQEIVARQELTDWPRGLPFDLVIEAAAQALGPVTQG